MTNKKILLGMLVLALALGMFFIGCDDGTNEDDVKPTLVPIEPKFPSGFIGTWKRDDSPNTLTFTSTTLKSSSQAYFWNLTGVSGDSYTHSPSDDPSYTSTITIQLVSGNLVISGDSGTGENNWNGTWKILAIEPKFPSGFIGTWKRDDYGNTLTFTSTTLKASNQELAWNLEVVASNDYTIKVPSNTGNRITITIQLVSGNIQISGDSGTGENNWNGTWKVIESKFPSGFIGTWKRDDYGNTLTFTSTTLKASNQELAWNLEVVASNNYTIRYPTTTGSRSTITIQLVSGNIQISGDSGTDENNWNGTWRKQ